MKRVKYAIVLLLTILTVSTHGDIIIVEYSPTKICVRITNLKDYPDIEVIGVGDCKASFSKPKVYIADSTSCIEVHKACPLTFYAVKKDYLSEKGIENINWKKDKNVMKSDMTITGKETTWHKNVEILELNSFIIGFNENSMIMFVSSKTNKFKNGNPEEVDSGLPMDISLDSLRESMKLRKTF